MSNELFIQHHLGIGDHIALNGLVHTLIEERKLNTVHLFCKEQYRKMLLDMYTSKEINLIGIPKATTKDSFYHERDYVDAYMNNYNKYRQIPLLRIGFNLVSYHPDIPCDVTFYNSVGIPHENRYSKFTMQRNEKEECRLYEKLNPNHEDYVFVHDDPSRGFKIPIETPYKIIRNDITESVFHYGKVIENAKEFHCIESCFRCFSETLNTDSVKLVHHNSVRNNVIATCKKWEVR